MKNGIFSISNGANISSISRVDVPAIATLVERLGMREAKFLILPPNANAREKQHDFLGAPSIPPKYSKSKFRKRFIVISKNPRNMFNICSICVHYVWYVYLDMSHTIYISYVVHLQIHVS